MTGFEPAISRFVAERVIRCATRIRWNLSVISKFIFHKNKKTKGEKASLQSWKDLAPHFTLAERSEIAAKSSERGASINAFYSRLITRNVCHSLWKKSSKQLIGVSSRSLNGSKKKNSVMRDQLGEKFFSAPLCQQMYWNHVVSSSKLEITKGGFKSEDAEEFFCCQNKKFQITILSRKFE